MEDPSNSVTPEISLETKTKAIEKWKSLTIRQIQLKEKIEQQRKRITLRLNMLKEARYDLSALKLEYLKNHENQIEITRTTISKDELWNSFNQQDHRNTNRYFNDVGSKDKWFNSEID